MKIGDRVVHKESNCILEVELIGMNYATCIYVWIPQKEYKRAKTLPGTRASFMKNKLEMVNGT